VQRYAVIGKPVSHSLSPAMQQAAFDALGIAATYEAIEASADDPIVARLRDEGYAGWNVTTPLKERVAAQLDELTNVARRAGAVNVVRKDGDRLIGHNTDGEGFVRAVEELWPNRALTGAILVLGSGPAARAIGLALRDAGVADERRALAVAPSPSGQPVLVVWAMPPGASVPPQISAFAREASLFFDCNYGRERSSQKTKGEHSDGLPMLLHQGVLSFEWWTGMPAPVESMQALIPCRYHRSGGIERGRAGETDRVRGRTAGDRGARRRREPCGEVGTLAARGRACGCMVRRRPRRRSVLRVVGLLPVVSALTHAAG
jgi:shikimate dehydrogenase